MSWCTRIKRRPDDEKAFRWKMRHRASKIVTKGASTSPSRWERERERREEDRQRASERAIFLDKKIDRWRAREIERAREREIDRWRARERERDRERNMLEEGGTDMGTQE